VAGPRLIDTGKPVDRKYGYAPAAVVERAGLVFISGMVGWDADGRVVEGVEAQAEQAFRNLADLLAQLGLDAGDVVMETEYVTDMALYPVIGRVRNAFFGTHRPAATLVEVKGLFRPGLVFEIQAIAATRGQ
jgi:enamine deaminase RidA (YjgF/YER057c/UK114 family)